MFSSINYGTDTSPEGRMVMFELLNATEKGVGDGETPVFPIQILKIKEGVTYDEDDFWLAYNNYEKAKKGELKYKAPNFDIFVRACEVSAKRLFPNFVFLDSSFNKHEKWNPDDPERWRYEIATMGCRTRVFDDVNGEKTTIGRGNLSFTSINLVRPAILAMKKKKHLIENKTDPETAEKIVVEEYLQNIRELAEFAADQLYARYLFQRKAKGKQFPFLMGQNAWKGGKSVGPNDNVGDVINSGTLSIGFIGLAEALVALIGKHHGESMEAQELGLKIVGTIRKVCDEYKEKYKLNYSCLATPAEGLSGRFTALDRKEFGIIPGITDREYYTNSSHVPVYYPIPAYKKIHIESQYHKLENAGHIVYVEMDAEAKKNIPAFMKLVREMHLSDAGYGAINHPVDRCLKCGHEGAIDDACPICGETEAIDKIRRITGYLVGTLDRWNSFKKAEEKDRVKHTICD